MDDLETFDDQGSIGASLEDLDSDRVRSPAFGMGIPSIPSHHSGFRSEESEPDSEPVGPWSPPAWRKASTGWFRHQAGIRHSDSASQSRQTSPIYEDTGDADVTLPVNIPLPISTRNTPRTSPEPVNDRERSSSILRSRKIADVDKDINQLDSKVDNPDNYIRFAMRAEVQHRTDNVENILVHCRDKVKALTKSPSSTISALIVVVLSITLLSRLFHPPAAGPVPDLIKVAGLARSFEPLIHYSENGAQQMGGLQETSVAVWDLAESVRYTNMESAPAIVEDLDNLSENLKLMVIELTRFFANVDGDVDSILIVMDWAKRELTKVSSLPTGSVSSAIENFRSALCRVGLLESSDGVPNSVGQFTNELFGQTKSHRTKATLKRTFTEFLTVLEEAIDSELTYSASLFALFESVDRQFLNLQRNVIRETDEQEREQGEMLSSLWTRVIGANASNLRKFEKNRALLASVRERTKLNKFVLLDHNGKLLQMKSNLEILRKRIVSPLVRSNSSSTLTVEEQIMGLDSTYEHLKKLREVQKGKLREVLYQAGRRMMGVGRDTDRLGDEFAIEGH